MTVASLRLIPGMRTKFLGYRLKAISYFQSLVIVENIQMFSPNLETKLRK